MTVSPRFPHRGFLSQYVNVVDDDGLVCIHFEIEIPTFFGRLSHFVKFIRQQVFFPSHVLNFFPQKSLIVLSTTLYIFSALKVIRVGTNRLTIFNIRYFCFHSTIQTSSHCILRPRNNRTFKSKVRWVQTQTWFPYLIFSDFPISFLPLLSLAASSRSR